MPGVATEPSAALLARIAGEIAGLREAIAALPEAGDARSRLAARWRRLAGGAGEDEGGATTDFARRYAEALSFALVTARACWDRPARASLAAAPELAELYGPEPELEPQVAAFDAWLATVELPDPGAIYEAFLAAHASEQRQRHGVYFTPPALVRQVLARVDHHLRADLDQPRGLAGIGPGMAILDPAAGAGEFLVGIVRFVHARLDAELDARGWTDYVDGQLLGALRGVELLATPWTIAVLRLRAALEASGYAFEPGTQLNVVRGDALTRSIEGRGLALVVGNPPFGREAAGRDRARQALLGDYLARAQALGAGAHVKNLYNHYVYFWRWASRAVFERGPGRGVVSLITPSSYLTGPGFVGMRESMRAQADLIEILDLGGEPRGGAGGANLFDIATPVCVGTMVVGREPGTPPAGRASLVYAALDGTREAKLARCEGVDEDGELAWRRAPGGSPPGAPFVVVETSPYARWPALTELFSWQHSGAQFKRTWPIAPTPELLERRWARLLAAPIAERRALFRETRDRKIDRRYRGPLASDDARPALAELPADAPAPRVAAYAYRPFDRQWCLADARLGDFLRPALWRASSPRQLYMSSLLGASIGPGPAAIVSAHVPDLHHFRGSYGGKDVIPLWADADGETPNLDPRWRARVSAAHQAELDDDALFAYAYAVLANPSYVLRFEDQLRVPGPRLPVSADRGCFERGVALGRMLLAGHGSGRAPSRSGAAWTEAVGERAEDYPRAYSYADGRLEVGAGCVAPVSAAVWRYAVSGYGVVEGWLGYRMRGGAGRRSSALDELRPRRWTPAMSAELLALIDLLDWTLAQRAQLDAWLEQVLAGPLL